MDTSCQVKLCRSWTRDSIPDETMGELCCVVKLSRAQGDRRGLHCLPTSHCHRRRRRGRRHYPQFLQTKLISSRTLLKEEILQSGTSQPVSSPHNTLLFTGAQLLCCCCQSRGPSP